MTDWTSDISARVGAEGGQGGAPLALDDAVLLGRCRSGDMSAFGALVSKYQDRVFNALLRVCGNHDDAEELCQETFVKGLENLAAFRQDSGFYTWLFRIGMNLAISHRRRGGRIRFQPLDAPGRDGQSPPMRDLLADHRQVDPHEAAAVADATEKVLKAVQELDEEFRVAVVLRDVEGMNYQQIAQVLNLPVGTVKSRIYRARSTLSEKLRDLMA
jgi:RNA polymerase sigma-70 factor (ECF subfamily)